jgi:hypothetical protein
MTFIIQKKLNEAFTTKNFEKFKMLLQRPIRRTLSALKTQTENDIRRENPKNSHVFKIFESFSMKMQPDIEATNSNYPPKFPCNDLHSQNILCYRKTSNDLSLLEKIMREPESEDFIAFVWNDCDFWRDSNYLMMVSLKNIFSQAKSGIEFFFSGQRTREAADGFHYRV